ncbi:NAD(P)-binding protein [Basidiobolus meristosporus CBS 931.73]|uniref:NAD(P)-binding protein n=1 Tax=Basidiobolus meristosporus CBS 931.73 TaxID=1314790 RepID=A0A1Y1XYI4_9FUNG|nr:NAD(P)-binding protein [Basidiobolus meristosporus CBS 931.73]|eukprot:ORX90799.1 NAD(P)-binding protein [Basidiobolus meristosporus CBS 931.73]
MEKIYIIGATGNIGQQVVKTLLSKGIEITVFARNEEKVKGLFGESKNLTFVQGDYDSLEGYASTIQGHSRLFLVLSDFKKMAQAASNFAKLAYDAGVTQIVHVSSFLVSFPWRAHSIGAIHRQAEEAIFGIQNRGSYVALRPAGFYTNQFWGDNHTIQKESTIFGSVGRNLKLSWISIGDIADLATVIMQEPLEKHYDAVYEMASEAISESERADIFSKALGKPITYTRVEPEITYKKFLSLGFPHNIAYNLASFEDEYKTTPGLSILLGRKPESFQDWVEFNKSRFM